MTVTVVILTLNEASHIERALRSVSPIASRCVVVDSGSTDDTVQLAQALGAEVLFHPFANQAQQFNWALDQLPKDTKWVFRLDADEVVSQPLAAEISARLPSISQEVAGLTVPRRISFMGRPIMYGGVFPAHILRLFRYGYGRSEDRWMDEHIQVDGSVEALKAELLDHNLNPLSWWIDKHNHYASREVVEILNDECEFLVREGKPRLESGAQTSLKRVLKERVYARLPIGHRALVYFFYRYFIRLGFLDGREGTAFHILQGFWYRYLVDIKLFEVKKSMRREGYDVKTAIKDVLGIDLLNSS